MPGTWWAWCCCDDSSQLGNLLMIPDTAEGTPISWCQPCAGPFIGLQPYFEAGSISDGYVTTSPDRITTGNSEVLACGNVFDAATGAYKRNLTLYARTNDYSVFLYESASWTGGFGDGVSPGIGPIRKLSEAILPDGQAVISAAASRISGGYGEDSFYVASAHNPTDGDISDHIGFTNGVPLGGRGWDGVSSTILEEEAGFLLFGTANPPFWAPGDQIRGGLIHGGNNLRASSGHPIWWKEDIYWAGAPYYGTGGSLLSSVAFWNDDAAILQSAVITFFSVTDGGRTPETGLISPFVWPNWPDIYTARSLTLPERYTETIGTRRPFFLNNATWQRFPGWDDEEDDRSTLMTYSNKPEVIRISGISMDGDGFMWAAVEEVACTEGYGEQGGPKERVVLTRFDPLSRSASHQFQNFPTTWWGRVPRFGADPTAYAITGDSDFWEGAVPSLHLAANVQPVADGVNYWAQTDIDWTDTYAIAATSAGKCFAITRGTEGQCQIRLLTPATTSDGLFVTDWVLEPFEITWPTSQITDRYLAVTPDDDLILSARIRWTDGGTLSTLHKISAAGAVTWSRNLTGRIPLYTSFLGDQSRAGSVTSNPGSIAVDSAGRLFVAMVDRRRPTAEDCRYGDSLPVLARSTSYLITTADTWSVSATTCVGDCQSDPLPYPPSEEIIEAAGYFTSCVSDPAPPVDACRGSCKWEWQPDDCYDDGGYWLLTRYGCKVNTGQHELPLASRTVLQIAGFSGTFSRQVNEWRAAQMEEEETVYNTRSVTYNCDCPPPNYVPDPEATGYTAPDYMPTQTDPTVWTALTYCTGDGSATSEHTAGTRGCDTNCTWRNDVSSLTLTVDPSEQSYWVSNGCNSASGCQCVPPPEGYGWSVSSAPSVFLEQVYLEDQYTHALTSHSTASVYGGCTSDECAVPCVWYRRDGVNWELIQGGDTVCCHCHEPPEDLSAYSEPDIYWTVGVPGRNGCNMPARWVRNAQIVGFDLVWGPWTLRTPCGGGCDADLPTETGATPVNELSAETQYTDCVSDETGECDPPAAKAALRTTTTSTSTTGCPPPSTTTTTSSTTTPPCAGYCEWIDDGEGGWEQTDKTCPSTCICDEPESEPLTSDPEYTGCYPSTTTTEPDCGGCVYRCDGEAWVLLTSNCNPDCGLNCPDAAGFGACTGEGDEFAAGCEPEDDDCSGTCTWETNGTIWILVTDACAAVDDCGCSTPFGGAGAGNYTIGTQLTVGCGPEPSTTTSNTTTGGA